MTVEEFVAAVEPIPRAKIFHAVQLRDLETYVHLGHVATRAELFEHSPVEYTPFGSDVDDQNQMDCAADCFGNLVDQGFFSTAGRGIPNVYGPITLVFYPVALRNSGSNEIIVRRGAIWSSDEAGRQALTPYGIRALFDSRGFTKRGELQVRHGLLRLADLAYVIVNPITINGQSLVERVRTMVQNLPGRNEPVPVYERKFVANGREIYDEFVRWAGGAPQHQGAYETLPAGVRESIDRLGDWKYANISRFAEYLSHGTLSRMHNQNGHLKAGVAFEDYEEPYYDDEADLLQRITSLDPEQLYDRDEAIIRIEHAELSLLDARAAPESDERDDFIEAAWREYTEAIENLNYWIEDARKAILAGRDEMHETIAGSHNSDLSAKLTGWADECEQIEIPYRDVTGPERRLINWRKVTNYSECGW